MGALFHDLPNLSSMLLRIIFSLRIFQISSRSKQSKARHLEAVGVSFITPPASTACHRLSD